MFYKKMLRNFKKINLINIIIFVSFIVGNNQEQRTINSGLYPNVFTLLNQNILMFDTTGIHFYNSDFTNEDSSKKIPFSTTFPSFDDNSKTTIAQFSSQDGGYVMVLVLDKMHFLTCEGTKIGEVDLSEEISGDHYSLTPYKKEDNELHYIISYIINDKHYKNFTIDYFKYNVNTQANERINSKNVFNKVANNNAIPTSITGISCMFLPNSNFDYEIFTCFYSVSFGIEIHSKSFDPKNDFEELDDYFSYYYDPAFTSVIAYLSAIPNENKQKVLVFYISSKPYWITFDFENKFSTPLTIEYNSYSTILDHYYSSKILYFRQTHEIVCSFSTSQMCTKYLLIFNNDLTLKTTTDISVNNCYNTLSYGIIFDGSSYTIINDNAQSSNPIIFVNSITDLGTSEIFEEPIIISEPTINIVDEKDKETIHIEEPTINIADEKDTETIHKEEPTINITINCDIEELFNNNEKCQINTTNMTQYKEIITNKIRNDLTNGNMDDLIKEVIDNNIDLMTKDKNVVYQITSSDNQNKNEYSNISTIQLGKCEAKLREINHIDPQIPLLILKIDNFEKGQLIPVIEYEVYEPINKTKLNLDVCKDIKIEISIPVSIEEDSLFKYNLSSDYYNDKCCPTTSDNGTDITLNDRKKEFFNNNLSLCEDNCDLIDYNSETKKAKCNCNVKTTISLSKSVIDKDKFFKNFIDLESIANIDVVKCYKLLFTKKIKYNYGNYILAFIIFIHFILLIVFLAKGYKSFMHQVKKIILNEGKKRRDSGKKRKKETISIPPKRKGKQRENKNHGIEVYNKCNVEDSSTKNELFMKLVREKNKVDLEKKDTKKYMLSSSIRSNIHQNTKNDNKIIYEIVNIPLNDFEINSLSYVNALEIDKRTFFQIYISFIKTKHIFIFAFFVYNDFNSSIIKICLFFYGFALYFTVNTLFFTDSTMHKIYEDGGVFNTFYQIPQILYSTFISAIVNSIIKTISLSEKAILEIKKNKDNRKKIIQKAFKCLVVRFIFFFILCFIFLFAFWFYISCFCAVYVNTQKHLIKDTFICFSLSLLYPFILHLISAFLRICSLKSKKKNKNCIYIISQLI